MCVSWLSALTVLLGGNEEHAFAIVYDFSDSFLIFSASALSRIFCFLEFSSIVASYAVTVIMEGSNVGVLVGSGLWGGLGGVGLASLART